MKLARLIDRLMPILEANPDIEVFFHTAARKDMRVLSVYGEDTPGSAGIAGVPWPSGLKRIEIDIGKDGE